MRVRDRGERGLRIDYPLPYGSRGRATLVLLPASGVFRLTARGVPAESLRAAGPAGVAVLLQLGEQAAGTTVDFEARGARRWEYRHAAHRPPGPPPPGPGPPPGPWNVTTIAQGLSSGIQSFRFEVVRDAASWQSLWQAHAGSGTPPSVDFATEMVVGVWLGSRPGGGTTVAILQVTPASIIGAPCTPGWCPPTGAMVVWLESEWGPSCGIPMTPSQPFHVVKTPRVDGPVMSESGTVVNDCP